jgi:hypothetical protein
MFESHRVAFRNAGPSLDINDSDLLVCIDLPRDFAESPPIRAVFSERLRVLHQCFLFRIQRSISGWTCPKNWASNSAATGELLALMT